MRAPVDTLSAPMIAPKLEWVNVASLRMDKQLGRPVLVEFWDFCRCNSLRTLPYVRAWHERYAAAGLRVISVHAGGYPPSQDPGEVRAAVARLGIEHPVVIDADFELWRDYGNEAWPARYLFDQRLRLYSTHVGEGAYAETESEICELLGERERAPLAPLRPEDDPGALLAAQTADQPGPWSGHYEAGGVWAALERTAPAGAPAPAIRANGRRIAVEHSGAVALVEHERHTAGELELEIGVGVVCHTVQFTPGVVA
ncbi:MAG TPA: DipZ protein [Solirubrobacteraceae bacterium]|nr:DipZ protein [Solirubrobacteraceae bacterium]